MPATNWSLLNDGEVVSFNPSTDILHFDDPSITAAFVEFHKPGDPPLSTIFKFGGKTVTLNTPPDTLTSGNVTFANGSTFRYGDNNTSSALDDGDNVIVSVSGDDFLTGAGGNDQIFGGPGNDALGVTWDLSTRVYGADTLDGGAGREDFLVYIDRIEGVTVTLGNEAAAGSATGGDGSSTLELRSIEGVFGTDFADTLNANSATQVSGRLNTDIVQFFEGGGGSDTINGALGDGRLTVVSYQFSPAAATISLGPFNAEDGYGTFDVFNNIDGVIGSAFNDTVFGGNGFPGSADEVLQFYEGMAGDDLFIAGSRAAYDHSPHAVVVNLSESAISGNFYGAGAITVNSETARDGWDSLGGGTDTIAGIDARGSKFDDTMVGSDDDDNWFEGGGGNDYIDGRGTLDDDVDFAEYLHATGAVVVNLGLGTAQGDSSVGSDTLINIEGIRGSDFNDVLVGGGSGSFSAIHVEFFQGMAGDDALDGGDSDPATLDVAEYWADPSAVIVNLSAGAINPFGTSVAARTARDGYGVAGHPTGIDTLVNINSASGSRFDDYLFGSDADNWLQGNAGHDTLIGGAGSDTVVFDEGGANVNLVTGVASDGMGFIDTLVGIENVLGSSQADTMLGDSQDNRLDGDGGDDIIDGGAGSDTAVYELFHEDGVDVDLAAGMAHDGDDDVDTLLNIENVIGSVLEDNIHGDSAANVLDGFGGDDALVGRAGNDTLIGGAGNDSLDGGPGNDRLIGGAGDDTYFVDSTGDRVIEAAGAAGGNDTVFTSIGIPIPANVENIVFTGTGSITINGTSGNNVIAGGANNDTLNGGAGTDTISYAQSTRSVTVNLATNLATGQGTDVLSGFENATGGSAADRLIGNSSNNVLDGSGGADTMTGGFGNDTYHVDRATDKVIETSNSLTGALLLPDGNSGSGLAGVSGITDTVVAAVTYSLNANALRFVENLTLTGSASRGTGNALANKLTGNDGNNQLDGKDGNDVLNGGAGNDSLNGGVGTDRLNGGVGDDILIWASTDTHDGAAGTDTLKVLSGNLDLTAVLNSRIKNVEQIDMTGSNNNTLTVNTAEVLAISSTTDTLTVLGNAGDVVNAAGFTQTEDSGGFNRYTSGLAILLVESDVTVVI